MAPIALGDVSIIPESPGAPGSGPSIALWAVSDKGDVLCRLGVSELNPAVSTLWPRPGRRPSRPVPQGLRRILPRRGLLGGVVRGQASRARPGPSGSRRTVHVAREGHRAPWAGAAEDDVACRLRGLRRATEAGAGSPERPSAPAHRAPPGCTWVPTSPSPPCPSGPATRCGPWRGTAPPSTVAPCPPPSRPVSAPPQEAPPAATATP